MPLEHYIKKDHKTLRLGYTTGSCAAAAAKAAAIMLLSQKPCSMISLIPPKGIPLELEVLDISLGKEEVSCGIQKDSGDDPDVTNGMVIYASVRHNQTGAHRLDGGHGVGRVTKRGLQCPVGEAAINPVPRQMILESLEEACRDFAYHGGLDVRISVPGGEEVAKRTFNPRLGIVGGISILGTSGIVEPMSEEALIDTIETELKQRRASGETYALLTPGNYGEDYIRDVLGIDPDRAVKCSNFIGDALMLCKSLGYNGVLLVGNIGKLVKLAGGMLNTHSKYGDCRMEILAAHSGACGVGQEIIREMLSCATCDDALRLLEECGLRQQVMDSVLERIGFHISAKTEGLVSGALCFSTQYGMLGLSAEAQHLLEQIRAEHRLEN